MCVPILVLVREADMALRKLFGRGGGGWRGVRIWNEHDFTQELEVTKRVHRPRGSDPSHIRLRHDQLTWKRERVMTCSCSCFRCACEDHDTTNISSISTQNLSHNSTSGSKSGAWWPK